MMTDILLDDYVPPTAHIPRKRFTYYDFGPVLSHNAEWNFIIGGRGLGKTYGAKKRAIKRALELGEEFIYLRRYEKERTKSRDTFFADLQANGEFMGWDFRVLGNYFEAARSSTDGEKNREWRRIGYALVLSTAQQEKSVSFPLVTTIIFDEFIIEKGNIHYLTNETYMFEHFFSTVDRWQDKTRVFFLANAVDLANPYFIVYGINPDENETFIKLNRGKAKGYIVVDFPDAVEFARQVSSTRFGMAIDGSEFASMAIGNNFKNSNKAMLGVKDPKALLFFNFRAETRTVAVWFNPEQKIFYIHDKVPHGQRTVTMNPSYLDGRTQLMLPNEPIMKRLLRAFRSYHMLFENALIRELWKKEVVLKCL